MRWHPTHSTGRTGSWFKCSLQQMIAANVALAALMMAALTAAAGEPIRFIRPKADQKAPLRINYSAEKAQAEEQGLDRGAVRPGTAPSPRIGAVRILPPNRRTPDREDWSASDQKDPKISAADKLRWAEFERAQRESENAGQEGFSTRSTFPGNPGGGALGQFGGVQNTLAFGPGLAGADSSRGGVRSDSPPVDRARDDYGLRSFGGLDAYRAAGRTEMPGLIGGSRLQSGFQPSSGPGLGPNNGLPPRYDMDGPGGRNPAFDQPAVSPSRPPSSPQAIESPSRPLRSQFDLPSRPR